MVMSGMHQELWTNTFKCHSTWFPLEMKDAYLLCRSEACTAFLLSPQPSKGGEPRAALFLGSTFVNQDGRSSSLTAPNGPSQQAVIRGALSVAELRPQQVQALEMHGTGTSLGDPIEVGAALAVFSGRAATLRLTAAKSRVGHSEAAAGASGIAQAAVQLVNASSAAIVHLRSINPLVASLVQAHVGAGNSQPLLPRQYSQHPAAASSPLASTGVSAFAFQGTNAHALLCQQDLPTSSIHAAANSSPGQRWLRQRLWFAPRPHSLLGRLVSTARPAVEVAALLSMARHAYLLDHRVAGRAILPGAAMYEAGWAAGQLLANPSLAFGQGPALCDISIPSPLLLRAGGRSVFLHMSTAIPSGSVRLSSGTGTPQILHLWGAHQWVVSVTPPLRSNNQLSINLSCFLQSTQHTMEGPGHGRHASSLARLGFLRDLQRSFFAMHPAVTDNVTQTCAALVKPQVNQARTRIPVGVGAFGGKFDFNLAVPLFGLYS